MFFSLISLTILSVTINYASSCASLGWAPREYSDWEKNWCREDLNRCAWHLCSINGHPCDDNTILNTIMPELRCKLFDQCQPRTDKLGTFCSFNSDCRNSNYRCWRNKCVHKNTVPVSYPSSKNGDRRCDKWDSECLDTVNWKCDRSKGLCVPKNGGRRGKDGASCDATADCASGYTCKNFRCVKSVDKGVSISVTFNAGADPKVKRCDRWDSECNDDRLSCDRGKGLCVPKNDGSGNGMDGASCKATPDCHPDYTCINALCRYTAGKGVKLSKAGGASAERRVKRCNRWDSECKDDTLKCDRKSGKCVPKFCRFSPDCAADYKCVKGECVLGNLQ